MAENKPAKDLPVGDRNQMQLVPSVPQGATYSISAEQLQFVERIGERRGRQQSAAALTLVVTAAELMDLQQIKDSKSYKGIPSQRDGVVVTIRTWADFCELIVGRSHQHVDDDLKNLGTFGPSTLEALDRLGFGYRRMRDLRAIPADERQQLIDAAKSGDETKVRAAAEDLIERHERERATHDATTRELKVTIAAKDKRFLEVQQQRNHAQEQLERREVERAENPEATQLKDLQLVTLKTQAAVCELLATVDGVMQQAGSESAGLAARQTLDYVCQHLAEGAQQRGLTLNFVDHVIPASMQPVHAAAAAGNATRGRRQ
jgi:hypothetical protein